MLDMLIMLSLLMLISSVLSTVRVELWERLIDTQVEYLTTPLFTSPLISLLYYLAAWYVVIKLATLELRLKSLLALIIPDAVIYAIYTSERLILDSFYEHLTQDASEISQSTLQGVRAYPAQEDYFNYSIYQGLYVTLVLLLSFGVTLGIMSRLKRSRFT